MKVDLTPEQVQCLVDALDSHVRAHGMRVLKEVAAVTEVLVAAIQADREKEAD